ncbi:MAG: hypothetical protein SFZ24_08335 [Planctomycetota bacterium]|nr:hypothetical protein [Planctomycetota bacterium]
MQRRLSVVGCVVARVLSMSLVLAVAFLATSARAQDVSFTYSGLLRESGAPAVGTYDLRFQLFSALDGGTSTSPAVCANDVVTTDGTFTVRLPFALNAAAGKYLEIAVRQNSGTDCTVVTGYTTLAPRQPLTPAPTAAVSYAIPVVNSAPVAFAGAMRFDPATNSVQVHNGLYWYNIATVTMLDAVAPASVQAFTTVGTHTFTVPPGIYSIIADVFGSSGGGGARSPGSATLPTQCTSGAGSWAAGGGGGGAGAWGRFRIDVTPGEILTCVIGAGGIGGGTTTNGGAGQITRVQRNGVDLIVAAGGGGGLRRSTSVVMGSRPSLPPGNCDGGQPGGGGGAGTPNPPFLAPGVESLGALAGAAGGQGRGPTCGGDTTCPGTAGNPALGGSTAGLGPGGTMGADGGQGGGPTGSADAGGAGRIYFLWN